MLRFPRSACRLPGPLGSPHPSQSQRCAQTQSRTDGQRADFSASRAASRLLWVLEPGRMVAGWPRQAHAALRGSSPMPEGSAGPPHWPQLPPLGKLHGHQDESPRSPDSRSESSGPSVPAVESGLGRAMPLGGWRLPPGARTSSRRLAGVSSSGPGEGGLEGLPGGSPSGLPTMVSAILTWFAIDFKCESLPGKTLGQSQYRIWNSSEATRP